MFVDVIGSPFSISVHIHFIYISYGLFSKNVKFNVYVGTFHLLLKRSISYLKYNMEGICVKYSLRNLLL